MKQKKSAARQKAGASPRTRRSTARPPVSSAATSSPTAPASDPEMPAGLPPKAPRKPGRKAPGKIPPVLLEGDRPVPMPTGGPGQRYAVGRQPGAAAQKTEIARPEGELPEAYGTRRVLLTARDPHWLYAHWDLTREQQRQYNTLSADRHLVLRIHLDTLGRKPVDEVHLHPESRHWFVHVERAGSRYIAELGFYGVSGAWNAISCSSPTLAPPDSVSPESTAQFATIPLEVPLTRLVELVKEALRENVPLAAALQELREQGHRELPAPAQQTPGWSPSPGEWTPEQEQALARVVSMDHVRRVWMGSLEITELIRRQLAQEMPSAGLAEWAAPTSPAVAAGQISSPAGREQRFRGFWFTVNAELIIYGATEADATVTIGGRKIKLRPDGTFSCRFALPDGTYELPIVAVSSDSTDGRAAELSFSRQTEYRGEVGASPQAPELKRPEPANV